MTSQPSLERKIHQLDNDVQSIYEMLASISGTQTRQGNRLEELASHLAAHDARFDQLDARLDGLEPRLDGLEPRLDGLERRLDGLERRLDGLDQKLDTILQLLQK